MATIELYFGLKFAHESMIDRHHTPGMMMGPAAHGWIHWISHMVVSPKDDFQLGNLGGNGPPAHHVNSRCDD